MLLLNRNIFLLSLSLLFLAKCAFVTFYLSSVFDNPRPNIEYNPNIQQSSLRPIFKNNSVCFFFIVVRGFRFFLDATELCFVIVIDVFPNRFAISPLYTDTHLIIFYSLMSCTLFYWNPFYWNTLLSCWFFIAFDRWLWRFNRIIKLSFKIIKRLRPGYLLSRKWIS